MNFPTSLRPNIVKFLMVGALGVELFANTGCVTYPNGQVGVAPVVVTSTPTVAVGYYGNPTGYYYRNNPVYVYNGRRAYYSGGRRYYYTGNGRYYTRGHRHYYY
ncbi:hypothetical protein BH09VER1_BH09VER1_37530 [soil metagenome]